MIETQDDFTDDKPITDWNTPPDYPQDWRVDIEPMTRVEIAQAGIIGLIAAVMGIGLLIAGMIYLKKPRPKSAKRNEMPNGRKKKNETKR